MENGMTSINKLLIVVLTSVQVFYTHDKCRPPGHVSSEIMQIGTINSQTCDDIVLYSFFHSYWVFFLMQIIHRTFRPSTLCDLGASRTWQ